MKKEKILEKIEKIEAKIKNSRKPTDMTELGQYQSWVNKEYSELRILKEKLASKEAKKEKSNKGDKVVDTTVEVVETTVEVTDINEIKSKMISISEVASATLSDITENIQLNDVEKVEAIEKLKEFVLKQEEIAKPYGLAQRATAALTRIPFLGEKMKETYADMKADSLESQNIKEIIYKVYDDMVAQGEKITKRVMKFNTLRKELQSSIDKTIELREEVIKAIEVAEEESMEQFELQKIQLQLNGQIAEFTEEIRNLQQIEIVTKGIAMQITENTPANKDRLLRKMASFATIADANNQLNAFKELRDLTTSLDQSIQTAIFDTVENVLDGEKQTQKELQIAAKRAEDFAKRAKAIDSKINEGKKQVLLSLNQNNDKVDQMVLEYKETKEEN